MNVRSDMLVMNQSEDYRKIQEQRLVARRCSCSLQVLLHCIMFRLVVLCRLASRSVVLCRFALRCSELGLVVVWCIVLQSLACMLSCIVFYFALYSFIALLIVAVHCVVCVALLHRIA